MKRESQTQKESNKPFLSFQKNNLMLILIIIVSCFIAQSFLPWWIIAPVCLAASFFFSSSKKQAFWSGFAGIFILWLVKILSLSLPNEHLLANKVGQVFMLPAADTNWMVMIFVSSLIGGVVGGLSSLTGYSFRKTN
jgi:hypothetical protein